MICSYCKKREIATSGRGPRVRKTCGHKACQSKNQKKAEAAWYRKNKTAIVERTKARRAARTPEQVAKDRDRDTERMRWYREGTEFYKKPKYVKMHRAANRRFYAKHKAEEKCQDCSKPVDFYHLDGRAYSKCCVCRLRERVRRKAWRQSDAYLEREAQRAEEMRLADIEKRNAA